MAAAQPDQRPNRTLSVTVAAFACGVLTLALCWVPLVGVLSLPLGLAALWLARIGRRHVRDYRVGAQPVASRGLVIVGAVTGVIGLVVASYTLFTFLRGFQGPVWRENLNEVINRYDLKE